MSLLPLPRAAHALRVPRLSTALLACGMLSPLPAFADSADPTLESVSVESSRLDPIGIADSANQGTVTAKQLENRPRQRTGDLLEAVPGVVVTQHSGDGKANQYFARGFNLDHGTDFRTTVMGMPVNMPTHAHGQGYSDLNFVIPELVARIDYRKGTYYAEEGDFSAAGAASIDYFRAMTKGLLSVEAGQNRYRRMVLANSRAAGSGTLLYGLEAAGNDGPWQNPEGYRRTNGVLSWSTRAGTDDIRLTAMAMQSRWNATDQIPLRAVNAGLIDRFGAVDPTDGGETARQSVSGEWTRHLADGAAHVNAYVIRSRLDLYSNFTYALDDPVNGDQFNQSERRTVAGLHADRIWAHQFAGRDAETTLGTEFRRDQLAPVALYATAARQRIGVTREDTVRESSAAMYASNTTRWQPWLRTIAGVRADAYDFHVDSSNPANSGTVGATIVSPKFSAVFTPSTATEFYLNWGEGFHSNDARGVTGHVDPRTGLTTDSSGNPIHPATPLVKAIGREAGVRLSGLARGLQTTLSVWELDLASELVFSGDAGTTEASRPSHRSGIELSALYKLAKDWVMDADLSWSRARFTDNDPVGSYVPGALARVASLGMTGEQGRWSGGWRLRYVGGRALKEDNSIRSAASTMVNGKIGYAITRDVKVTAEILNIFNREVADIEYDYVSRLRNETVPVDDLHFHPAEPRSVRLGLVMRF